jgi:uncharacterized protein (UPF0218 family)
LYKLPEGLRNELRDPLGEVIPEETLRESIPAGALVIAVGDMVAHTCYRMNVKPQLTIIDFHTQREGRIDFAEDLQSMGERVVEVKNPAGELTRQLWQAIKDALASEESVRIEVDGEEDLATIPCVLLAPNDSYLLYGLWNAGLVLVKITPAVRKRAESALKLMEV